MEPSNNHSKSKYLDFVESQFEKCFFEKGYAQEQPVKIISKIDDTVAFVGSTISPMKKYLLNNAIGRNGRFLIQNCMRTQVLKSLQNAEPKLFGTYFKGMGLIAEPDQLERVVADTFDYLMGYLNIPQDEIRIRINSKDTDLIKSIEQVDKGILREVDTFDERVYRHKYGLNMQGITGRNFNIGVRKQGTDKFFDIGNILVMENKNKKYAIEMGVGNCTLSMCYFGLDSTVQSSRMADVFEINSVERMKLADAIIVVAILQSENIQENPKYVRYFKGLFKKYNAVIPHWQEKLKVSDAQVLDYMNKFVALEYKMKFDAKNTWREDETVQQIANQISQPIFANKNNK